MKPNQPVPGVCGPSERPLSICKAIDRSLMRISEQGSGTNGLKSGVLRESVFSQSHSGRTRRRQPLCYSPAYLCSGQGRCSTRSFDQWNPTAIILSASLSDVMPYLALHQLLFTRSRIRASCPALACQIIFNMVYCGRFRSCPGQAVYSSWTSST